MYIVESASAQPNLLLSKINSTVIFVPNINLQNQFADFVKQIDKSKSAKAMKEPNCHIIYYMLHFIQNDFNKNNLNEM